MINNFDLSIKEYTNKPNSDLTTNYIKINEENKIIIPLCIDNFNVKNKNNYNFIQKIIPTKNMLIYLFKKIFTFTVHLSLICLFETFFFFSIVSVYENNAIIKIISKFFNKIPNICKNFTTNQKIDFTNFFNSFINITQIDNKANLSSHIRKKFNNTLLLNAWMYFLSIIIFIFILLLIKIYYKIKINFKKIIFENLIMILILAIYEYAFFKSIILLYQNISEGELIKIIINQFHFCLI
jgi:hypothetical protein